MGVDILNIVFVYRGRVVCFFFVFLFVFPFFFLELKPLFATDFPRPVKCGKIR